MSRSRHALTIIEMAVLLAIAGLIIGGSLQVLSRMQRFANADTTLGVRAELACDQLRRDAANGPVTSTDAQLQLQHATTTVVWHRVGNEMLRNDRPLLKVSDFHIERQAGLTCVCVTPLNLPPRRIELLTPVSP